LTLGEKEKTQFGTVIQEMKLEIWTDEEYKGRPAIWNLCDVRGITNYFTGELKRVIKDKPEKNENLKIYFADRTIMDEWQTADRVLLCEDYCSDEIFLPVFQRNINWCKRHKIKTYVDMVWECIDDHMFHEEFKHSRLWKYFVDNDIKIVCHTSIDHPNLVDINRFFELEFTTTLYSERGNHSSLYLAPKWYDEKKYLYCSHLGCVATKYDIQRFLIRGEEEGLFDDEFFWSVLNKRPEDAKESVFWEPKYEYLFNANTWESRTENYYNNTILRETMVDKRGKELDNNFELTELERRISPQMMDSECYVVFENTYAFHTEKLMKPIYAQIPFIIYARPHQSHKTGEPNLLNANKRIKKLGYEIFDEVFDYSFEDKGLIAEEMMDEFIKELIRVKKEGRKIWEQPSIKEKIRYNHYLLLKRSSTEEMMTYLHEMFLNDK